MNIATSAVARERADWSRRAHRFDLVVVVVTIAAAVLTLWFASAPVMGTRRLLLLVLVWPVIGIAWSVSVAVMVRHRFSFLSAMVLLVGAGGLLTGIAPIALMILFGLWPAIGVIGLALVLVAGIILRERRRIIWAVAPTIVVATIVLSLSGIPRSARFAMAEPELTAYATQLLERPFPDTPPDTRDVTIGGIKIRRADVESGCLHLYTTRVGLLADGPAGVAYCPAGPPAFGRSYEPLSGAWYRWWRLTFD